MLSSSWNYFKTNYTFSVNFCELLLFSLVNCEVVNCLAILILYHPWDWSCEPRGREDRVKYVNFLKLFLSHHQEQSGTYNYSQGQRLPKTPSRRVNEIGLYAYRPAIKLVTNKKNQIKVLLKQTDQHGRRLDLHIFL